MIKLRINQKKYYDNKSKFVRLYKKLGLRWTENLDIGDVWTNPDRTSYLRKIPEQEGFKRFYALNVPELVEFLVGIGAEIISDDKFEEVVVKESEPFYHEDYSGHKSFRELLESMPLNFGVKWIIPESEMTEFQKKWRELEVKYSNYKFTDLLNEIESKNVGKVEEKKEVINEVGVVKEGVKRKVFKIKVKKSVV